MVAISFPLKRSLLSQRLLPCFAAIALVASGVGARQGKYGPVVYPKSYTKRLIAAGTVLPFRLTKRQSTTGIRLGEMFIADLETSDIGVDPKSLSTGAVAQGHISFIRHRKGDLPGLIGVAFDRLVMPDGYHYHLTGTLINVGPNNVERKDGRWVLKAGSQEVAPKGDLRGPHGEPLVPLVTKGDHVSDWMIGVQYGWDSPQLKEHRHRFSDVDAEAGSQFGILLTQDLKYNAGPKWHM